MYFDEAPKSNMDDFYNYRIELNKLASGLKTGTRLTLTQGFRRAGKTSLILTALHNASFPSLVIDGRSFPESPVVTRAEFVGAMQRSLNKFLKDNKSWRKRVKDAIRGVNGVEIQVGTSSAVRLSWGGSEVEAIDLPALFKALGEVAQSQGTYFVIVFDEAQEFSRLRGYNLPLFFSYIYDYIPGIELVVTGSATGLVHNFLNLDDTKAPLFGRAFKTITLNPLSQDSSKEYLSKGFEQVGIKVAPELIDEIVESLDGIIGWLTYCGVQAKFNGRMDRKILKMTLSQGAKLAVEEFNHFLLLRQIARRRYVYMMSHLSERPRRWSELKRAIENDEGKPMNDKVFTTILESLKDGGFVVKREEEYYIADPLLRHAFREGLILP